MLVRPLLFEILFYGLTSPKIRFLEMYVVLLGVSFVCTGIGHNLSIIFEPTEALLVAVILPLVFGVFFNGTSPSIKSLEDSRSPLICVTSSSFARWAVEALTIKELEGYPAHLSFLKDRIVSSVGYNYDNWQLCIVVLFAMGSGLRAAAYVLLIFRHRDKQV